MPLILNQVASVADAVEDIAFGTAKGPTFFGPFERVMSAASTMVRADGPPEPMMMGALVGDVLRVEPGVLDRLLHGDVIPGRALAEKAHGAAIDHAGRIERRRALHLRTKAELGICVGAGDV